jgi:dynein heavy chain
LSHLLQENQELFKATADTDTWKAYVDYVDEMVVEGFFYNLHCSVNFLLENTEAKSMPLFEAQLELQVPEMVFLPSLDYGVADGFYDLVDGLVGDIYKQSSLIPRLAKHSGQEHYQVCCTFRVE